MTDKSNQSLAEYLQGVGLTYEGKLIGGVSRWPLPKVPEQSYTGGCNAGAALADLFFDWLVTRDGETGGGELQSLVLGLADPENRLADGQSGQIVGFFCRLEFWLGTLARQTTPAEDLRTRQRQLALKLWRGMHFTKSEEEDLFKASEKELRSRAAKRGWERRRNSTSELRP